MGELDLTLGALEIGILVATMMYGLSIVQAYTYSTSDSAAHDPVWMKAMVLFLGVCETAHSILIWCYLYDLTVAHMGQTGHLTHLPWTFDLSLALSGVIGATTQAFSTYRVFRIARNWPLALFAWSAAALRAGLGVALTVVAVQGGSLEELRRRYDPLVYVALGVSVALDVVNSAALCWHLKDGRTGGQAKGVVNKIMLWSIETGLATTAAAAVVLVCWITMPDNGLWLCFFFIYSKLYSNSLLISLNSRQRLRQTAVSAGMTSFQAGNAFDGITITRTLDVETAAPVVGITPVQAPRRYRSAPSEGSELDMVPWSPLEDDEEKILGKEHEQMVYGVAV